MRFREQLGLIQHRFHVRGGEQVAERLGVSASLDVRPGRMSGGEERRCELALAVTRRPRCLIADEPLTEIEPKDRGQMAAELRELARQGTAVLLTGHEVVDLLEIADEVIWITAGTTHGLGSADEARAHGQFRREYLGPGFDRPDA
jgi:ABC-type lipopolysaccharide export system ATPase subunit